MQASDATLKAHDRDLLTALAHRTSSLEHRSYEFNGQDDLAREFLTAPARGAVNPHSYLNPCSIHCGNHRAYQSSAQPAFLTNVNGNSTSVDGPWDRSLQLDLIPHRREWKAAR